MTASAQDIALLDRWQRDFPLAPNPFAIVGRSAGLDEAQTIASFASMRERGMISRIGAVVRPHTAGASVLAAMRVPPSRLDEVADIVSAEALVNHNYERAHDINLWFVVAGPDRAAVAATIARIGEKTGLPVIELPLLQAYHIDLGFPLARATRERPAQSHPDAPIRPEPSDRALLAAIEDGIPLAARPYREIANAIGACEDAVLDRLRRLIDGGVVTRFGCVIRHRALGYCANAMAVWEIADDDVDRFAALFLRHPQVTLCYRRARQRPDWPYNLFCMVHAKSRDEAHAAIAAINATAGTTNAPQMILFSVRCFKQRGARFSQPTGVAQ